MKHTCTYRAGCCLPLYSHNAAYTARLRVQGGPGGGCNNKYTITVTDTVTKITRILVGQHGGLQLPIRSRQGYVAGGTFDSLIGLSPKAQQSFDRLRMTKSV